MNQNSPFKDFGHNDISMIYRLILRAFFKDITDNFKFTPEEELQKIYPFAANSPMVKRDVEAMLKKEIDNLISKYRGDK